MNCDNPFHKRPVNAIARYGLDKTLMCKPCLEKQKKMDMQEIGSIEKIIVIEVKKE